MGRASTDKRIARAAGAGGSRLAGRQIPIGFYSALVLIVIIGIVMVVFSRNQRLAASPTSKPQVAHLAYAFDICGTIEPPLSSKTSNGPIKLTKTGLITVTSSKPATLAQLLSDYKSIKLTASTLSYPGSPTYTNGQKCGTKVGQVMVGTWSTPSSKVPTLVKVNPSKIILHNNEMITIAFLPKGTKPSTPPGSRVLSLLKTAGFTSSAFPSTTSSAPSTTSGTGATPTSTTVPSTTTKP